MKILFLTLILLTSVFSIESFNRVNKTYTISSEKELKQNYFSTISPHFYKSKLHYFTSFDNLKIAYKIFPVSHSKASLVISSGRTEGMVKYQELIYDLNQNGYSVYILDHRGQGYSQRMLADVQLGYVYHFEDYVKDLHQFVRDYVPKSKNMILIAHSMGGAIASLYVEEYPYNFDGLVLSSPMHQPDLLGASLTNIACELMELRDRDIDRYVLGEKSYDDEKHIFKENLLTHSKLRYEISKIAYDREPETKVGGPSVRWVKEACKGSKKSVDNANKIKIPVLLLQAEDDKIVNKNPQATFCKNTSPHCKEFQIDGAYHELFMEKDSIRDKALTAVLDFIAKIVSD